MVVEKKYQVILFPFVATTILFCSSCEFQNKKSDLFTNADLSRESSWIKKSTLSKKPIAALINMPNYSDFVDSFELKKDSRIHIYAVGEILYGLTDSEKAEYYLKGDEVILGFDQKVEDHGKPTTKPLDISLLMDVDTVNANLPGLMCKWKRDKLNYTAEIKVPWKDLNFNKGTPNLSIDVSIGDNDDNYVQKARVALFSQSNLRQFGMLKLLKNTQILNPKLRMAYALPITPKIDGLIDDAWKNSPSYPIKNLIYGKVKDSLDLAGFVRFGWDIENLYLLCTVSDANVIRIKPNERSERKIFLDYGWIENTKGQVLWEMDACHSRWAGGALKNQKIDTVIVLKSGKYKLRYVTDESHAFKQWDDTPPATSFYGIILFPE